MKRTLLLVVLATGLLSLVLSSTSSVAAGFVQKTVACPKSGFVLLPSDRRTELEDVIISADAPTDVSIIFGPPKVTMMTVYLDANETVVTNFQGQVEGEEGQSIKMSCSGAATVSITLVGNETI